MVDIISFGHWSKPTQLMVTYPLWSRSSLPIVIVRHILYTEQYHLAQQMEGSFYLIFQKYLRQTVGWVRCKIIRLSSLILIFFCFRNPSKPESTSKKIEKKKKKKRKESKHRKRKKEKRRHYCSSPSYSDYEPENPHLKYKR